MKEGNAELLADAPKLAAHPKPQIGVERAERLVEKHQFGRITSVRARATRCFCPPEIWWTARSSRPGEANEVEHLQRARARFAFAAPPGAVAQAECDIVEHREMRKQREILKHEANAAEIRVRGR